MPIVIDGKYIETLMFGETECKEVIFDGTQVDKKVLFTFSSVGNDAFSQGNRNYGISIGHFNQDGSITYTRNVVTLVPNGSRQNFQFYVRKGDVVKIDYCSSQHQWAGLGNWTGDQVAGNYDPTGSQVSGLRSNPINQDITFDFHWNYYRRTSSGPIYLNTQIQVQNVSSNFFTAENGYEWEVY